jgi:hypothetical protein
VLRYTSGTEGSCVKMASKSLVYPSMTIKPVVIDLGKTKASRIKDLKRGEGKLMQEVCDVADQVRASLGADAANKELIPIVLVYKKKTRRRNAFGF